MFNKYKIKSNANQVHIALICITPRSLCEVLSTKVLRVLLLGIPSASRDFFHETGREAGTPTSPILLQYRTWQLQHLNFPTAPPIETKMWQLLWTGPQHAPPAAKTHLRRQRHEETSWNLLKVNYASIDYRTQTVEANPQELGSKISQSIYHNLRCTFPNFHLNA